MPENQYDAKPEQEIFDPGSIAGAKGVPPADRLKMFTTPLSRRGWPVWLVYLAAVLGVIYVLNPTMGIFELIPDNLPFIGNIDEGVAFLLIWFGLVEYLGGKKAPGV